MPKPRVQSKPEAQKPWSIRIAPKKIKELQVGAAKYGLPTQTYLKIIIDMGLMMEENEGNLYIIGDNEDVEAAVAHNRRNLLAAKKAVTPKPRGRPRKVPTVEEAPIAEVEPEIVPEAPKLQEASTAAVSGGSKVSAMATIPRRPEASVDFLADAGVAKPAPPPTKVEDDLDAILAGI